MSNEPNPGPATSHALASITSLVTTEWTVRAVRNAAGATSPAGQPSTGRYGRLTVGADGDYRYEPGAAALALNDGERVVDLFTYTLVDAQGTATTASLNIVISGEGRDARGSADGAPITAADWAFIRESDLLHVDHRNGVVNSALNPKGQDVDPAGGAVRVARVSNSAGRGAHPDEPLAGVYGLLLMHADGSYSYTPNKAALNLNDGDLAVDVFTYQVMGDSGVSAQAELNIFIAGESEASRAAASGPAQVLTTTVFIKESDVLDVPRSHGLVLGRGTQAVPRLR